MFPVLLENTATKRESNLFTLIIKMQILFACAITASTARASSVFLSKETRILTNRRANFLLLCYDIQKGFGDTVISYFLVLSTNNVEFKRGNAPYLLSSIEFKVLCQHKNFIPPRHYLINLNFLHAVSSNFHC